MKKLTFLLIAILSILAMAAQKPCGEVFPNLGLKASLGVDGSRCVVSKFKNERIELIGKFMVSQDNSFIRIDIHTKTLKDEKKDNTYFIAKCEDVGAGQRFECEMDKIVKGEPVHETSVVNLQVLGGFFQFGTVSNTDLHYLFGGPAPWEIMY